MSGGSDGLHMVYAARGPDELAQAYSAWSDAYDRETLGLGYCLPFVIAGWVARHVPKGAGPILDVGCGTGLAAAPLAALGYPSVEGLDFSPEMLEHAARRGGYARLTRATLGEPLPWPDATFAAAFSTGVFTEGHAPAASFAELARIVRPGGHVIATVRDGIFGAGGFGDVFAALEAEGRWTPLEQSPSFRAFALAEPDVTVRVFVFRIGR